MIVKIENMNEKELLISLIKDDLINVRLVVGLDTVGLDSSNYFLHLSQTIFRLMGFKEDKRDNKLYDKYIRWSKKVLKIDINQEYEKLDAMALEIYLWLSKEKTKRVHKTTSNKTKHEKKNH